MEEENKAPVRVRLVLGRHLLTKRQRSEGLRRCWVVIRPELDSVAEFSRDITSRFGLTCSSGHDLLLSINGFAVPPFESTSIFRDNDKIRIKGDVSKKKKTIADSARAPQIEGNELIKRGTAASSSAILLIDNGENAIIAENATVKTKKKKKKKTISPLSEETGLKRKKKEVETLTNSKKKKSRLEADERPLTINEIQKKVPAVETSSHFHTFSRQPNALAVASEGNEQLASIGKRTSTGFRGGPNKKNVHGVCPGNGTHLSLRSHLISDQTRFMSPGAGPSNWQEDRPRDDGPMTRRTLSVPRSGFNGPNTNNRNRQQWKESSGPSAPNLQMRMENNFTTERAAENVISDGKAINDNKLDFESLYPLPRLPKEGDIIAYRLGIIDFLGCPELSSFRVGEVIVFDPVLMIIFLSPVPEYPTLDCELSEAEKSIYQEDGGLEIDFESLVDLRLVKECRVKIAPKMHKSGKGDVKSKNTCRQDDAENSLSLLGGNNNNANSAWEVGEASNAREATESIRDAWAPSTSRAGASMASAGPCGTGFGSHGGFPRGMNDDGNSNTNSAWEAIAEAGNANGGTPTQQNSWDSWAPSTSRAGVSRPHTRQLSSGSRFHGSFSRGGRSGRGRRNFNRRFNN